MPDGSPLYWPVADIVAAYRTGELSPVDVARTALDRIEHLDGDVHAFVTVDALDQFPLTFPAPSVEQGC